MNYISMVDTNGRVSSIGTDSKNPKEKNHLVIIGNLEHGALIRPKTITDANNLIKWLEKWKSQQNKGEFYADFDHETQLYCVFHTDKGNGKAFSSWASMAQAEKDANERNIDKVLP